MKPLAHTYYVYGITLHSEILLALPEHGCGDLAHIELRTAPASYFVQALQGIALEQVDGSWYQIGRLPDGSSYLRWEGVGEFLISADGRHMSCRQFDRATSESFQVYMLGRAFSFALVQLGFEPFHATAVVIHGEAIAFFGSSGFGKSTLAAHFLSRGHKLLTDDLLLLQRTTNGVLAYPGPSRIKLFAKPARRFSLDTGGGVRMNDLTRKLIIPLGGGTNCSKAAPIRVAFSMAAPREVFAKQRIRLELLPPRNAFLELLKNTFNEHLLGAERLQRQFIQTSLLVNALSVRKLYLPRDLDKLSIMEIAVLSCLSTQPQEAACVN